MKPPRLHALIAPAVAACLLACAPDCDAQSLGIGFGLGIPLTNYITNVVDRDYRVTPTPGYYPILRDESNSLGSLHMNASLMLNLDLPVDIEIRFDLARMRWSRSTVTNVTCSPVTLVDNSFDDAIASYIPIGSVDPSCLNTDTYAASRDISEEERASLFFIHISGGARYSFLKTPDWNLNAGAHAGFTISYYDGDSWFGANAGFVVGAMYRLTEMIWICLDARLMLAITQPPESTQSRMNHEAGTGGNIISALLQPEAYVDFQFSIRFDLSVI